MVERYLVRLKLRDYFLPIRVTNECEEDIRNSFASHNSHRILIRLHHETWRIKKLSRENNSLTHLRMI
jgi:hypothetical protein